MNKRWYDVDPTVSLAVSLMRNANIITQYKCANLIVEKSKENGLDLSENIIADAFNKMHKDLYYYHKQSGLEIDFVTRYNNELTLIEVKSNNGNAKSLKEILNNKEKYDISSNFKLADTNIGISNGINTIPLYMAFLIK